jgi:HAD superfamily hydrolase (TIGR01509 family)
MQLDIPPGDFDAYIFDLDGTLVDTMPVHYRAWDLAMHEFGLRVALDLDLFYSLGGVPTHRVAQIIAEHYGLNLDPGEVMHRKETLFKECLAAGRVPVIEPVVAFARKVASTHPIAIVTGGGPDVAGAGIAAGGLQDLFGIVVTPEDVPPGRGKPAPDMFLLAAARLKVPPGRCLVFEDAKPGIEAARAAGMSVVVVDSRPSAA